MKLQETRIEKWDLNSQTWSSELAVSQNMLLNTNI